MYGMYSFFVCGLLQKNCDQNPILRMLFLRRFRNKYTKTTRLIPPGPKKTRKKSEITINNILNNKSTVPVFKDLKENSSKLVFIKMTKRTVSNINPGLEIATGFKKEKAGSFINRGSPPKNRAIDGVGRPTK